MSTMKLRKKTKSSIVFEQLRSDILNGTYHPGDKLQMEELKNRYQIGLSPLREALSRLTTTGLVNIEEQCGFYVAEVSLDELQDLYLLRSLIEKKALELAIKQGNTQWEAEILSSWHSLNKYLESKTAAINFDELEKLQKKFNLALINACNSPWMIKIHNLLDDQALRYRSLCLRNFVKDKNAINSYLKINKKLVHSVVAREKDKSLKILQEIWNDAIESITDNLNREE